MKKIMFLLVAVVLVAGCAKKGYSDIREVMNGMLDAQEAYMDGLANAESAEDVAAAMNTLADNMEKIGPEIKKLTEKYPEIMKENKMPDELKDINERQAKLQENAKNIPMEKIGAFMSDEKVMAAAQRIGQAMQTMM